MERLRSFGRAPILAAAVVLLVVIAAAAAMMLGEGAPEATASPSVSSTPRPSPSPSPTPEPTPTASPTPEPAARCPLTGLPLDDPAIPGRVALAVSIDNHPGARPGRNLSRADLVVEAPVEGDTTRFVAIFLCQPTEGLTGPVRSGRYYMIDLWQDLHLLPTFFGASWETLARLDGSGMPYVNGITGGWPWFQRAGEHSAPHNLYADLEKMRAAFGANARLDGLVPRVGSVRSPFAFDPDAVLPAGRSVASLEIRTNSYWRIGWTWDAADAAWLRSDGRKPVVDEISGDRLAASYVLVQRVTQEIVYDDPDPGGNTRRYQHLVGEGDATLYAAGQAFDLHWSRPTATDGTTWTWADSGEPMVLPPGVIWWEIIPTGAGLTES